MRFNVLKEEPFLTLKDYLAFLGFYFRKRSYQLFFRFESTKDLLVGGLVVKRGKYVKPFLHSSISNN